MNDSGRDADEGLGRRSDGGQGGRSDAGQGRRPLDGQGRPSGGGRAADPVPGESPREVGERLARVVAEAAAGVPGVAFLRPRLSDLLRGSATAARLRGAAGNRTPAGVRVRRDAATAPWRVEVHLTVRHGHRALDVAREVRAAGERAVAGVPVEIAVTVAGIA